VFDAQRTGPRWIVVEDAGAPRYVLSSSDLLQHLEEIDGDQQGRRGATIDLDEIRGTRFDVASIDARATLYEAWEALKRERVDALCVRRGATNPMTLGILTREDVARFARLDT